MRRKLARTIALAAVLASLGAASPASAQEPPGPLRVYVLVLDGMKPQEVGALTPTLSSLRSQGVWYEQARAAFPAETIPNHAAMMTGVLPGRSGIIGNQYWRPNESGVERWYMEKPDLLEADTLVTRLENSCGAAISTATVMSKDYLYGIFRGEAPRVGDPNPQREADFHWQAPFYIPESGHIPDTFTFDAFRTWVQEQPATLPQFAFVNLGDIDRTGHADEVGGATSGMATPARQAAIEDTDAQLGRLVDDLQASGAWDDTVLILTSDHGMDWGPQNQNVALETELNAAGYTNDDSGAPGTSQAGSAGDYQVVGGGGSGTIYVEDDEDIPDIAQLVSELDGVDFIATRNPVPGLSTVDYDQIGLDHPNSGDITMFVEPRWHDGDGGNFLPGNHGHPATQNSVLLVAGGHPTVRAAASIGGEQVYDPGRKLFSRPEGGPGNLSIAPTVAALFGLGAPAGGYDGPALTGAFEPYSLMPHRACAAGHPGYPRPKEARSVRIPLVPAYAQCTEPNREHGPPLAHPSCAPPRRESRVLTLGSPDSNGRPARGQGVARLTVAAGDPETAADEADVRMHVSLSDVRSAAGLGDYGGALQARAQVRITDRGNGAEQDEPGTVVDIPFPANMQCAPTAGPEGSTCSLTTTFDAVSPGSITEGARAVWQLGAFEVRDDENATFARQGLFVP